ncbi:MAG: biopolymer transporter ExbD [Candidatus Aminicenantes bacterium]|nr:biopolymer transporter ExbD [Candidatus Aminicenantes bacterium]
MGLNIGGEEKVKSEPNVVPLCDVLLVLLIIFMVLTPLITSEKGTIKLPVALNTIDMPDKIDVALKIRKDGTMFLNQDTKPVTLENLQTALEEAFLTVSEKKLYIKADMELEFGKIVDIIDILKDAGIDVIGIITEKKTEKAE